MDVHVRTVCVQNVSWSETTHTQLISQVTMYFKRCTRVSCALTELSFIGDRFLFGSRGESRGCSEAAQCKHICSLMNPISLDPAFC